jgi:hypothetical protein
VYESVAEHAPNAAVIVPPRSTAVPSASAETAPTQRDQHIQEIAECGRMGDVVARIGCGCRQGSIGAG